MTMTDDRASAGAATQPPNRNGPRTAGYSRESAGRRILDELFERFPYGLLVVDQRGAVVGMNESCRKLFREPAGQPDGKISNCCDLVCRRLDDKPDTCLTRRAFDSADPLPEVRIDLPSRANAGAAWVTVVTNCPGEAYALFHLRPGQAGDRRRGSGPHEGQDFRLRIFTLGETVVEGSSGPVGGDWLGQRPGHLLKYLASRQGRPAQTEEIAEALWPGSDTRSLSSVRYFVHTLRSRLEPGRESTSSSVIVSTRGGYSLDPERVWIDAEEFEGLVAAGLAALVAREHEAARNLLQRAIDLYRGDFLADEPYAEWAIPERERMRELVARALRALVELCLAVGDVDGAEGPARRLADIESYDTDAQRLYIELCLKQGRRTEAARRYELFRRRTMANFGEVPDFQLSDLARGDRGQSERWEADDRSGGGP